MTEARYVDLLIVKNGEQLLVAEANSGWVHTGDVVEIEPVPGCRVICEVIDDAMFSAEDGDCYAWIAKLHTIYPVLRRWRLDK